MPTSKERRRFEACRHELDRLVHRGLDRSAFVTAAAETLAEAVPFDGGCWHTMDPATLLIASHQTNLSGEGFVYICRNEYLQDDVGKFASLAGNTRPATTLSRATGGNLELSARYRDIYRPHGWDSELRGSFDAGGLTWGSVMLLRAAGEPAFTAAEETFLASVGRHFAHGLRVAGFVSDRAAGAPASPGMLVLDSDGEVEAMDRAAEEWLAEIIDTSPAGQRVLPAAVLAAAARVRAAGRLAMHPPAQTRLVGRSGRWLTVHASVLGASGDGRVGVVVELSRPVEVEPLIAAAYGLTPREREVLSGVLRGRSTAELAAALVVSPHTVQDHLKAIFEKTGACSRRDLAARIFYLKDPSELG